jgi:hypothetical protein
MLRDEDKSANFLGALRGHAKCPLITFNSLEDQAAPQNSFIFTKCVDSIRIACGRFLFVFSPLQIHEGH